MSKDNMTWMRFSNGGDELKTGSLISDFGFEYRFLGVGWVASLGE